MGWGGWKVEYGRAQKPALGRGSRVWGGTKVAESGTVEAGQLMLLEAMQTGLLRSPWLPLAVFTCASHNCLEHK